MRVVTEAGPVLRAQYHKEGRGTTEVGEEPLLALDKLRLPAMAIPAELSLALDAGKATIALPDGDVGPHRSATASNLPLREASFDVGDPRDGSG